ncbi:MAG TPA: helix-turn-helix transcriptional regulator [Actinomycetota bacterium]|nr:helix-turn-helix transcriptional regulator [Actinomycetota bacterium]
MGEALRQARMDRGWTLRRVSTESGIRLPPSTLGGYERGERAISLERFCELARVYGTPPDALLSDVLRRLDPEGRRELRVNLNRLSLVPDRARRVLARTIERVRAQREDYLSDVITLREGDLEVVAHVLGRGPAGVLEEIRPAIERGGAQR